MTVGGNNLEIFEKKRTHTIAENALLNGWGISSSLRLRRETLGMRFENTLVAALKLAIVPFQGLALNIK